MRETVLCLSAVLALAIGAAGCGNDGDSATVAASARATAARTDPAVRPQIVCLGDSLTAGLGLEPDEAYPALLQQRLRAAGYRYEVVNAGVSGDTSAGGLRRLSWSLGPDARVLIVALGGNDGLRGLPVSRLRDNLAAIIEQAQARGLGVLLAGMEAPPNLGRAYTREFRDAYAELARTYDVPFVPFMLDGVAGVPSRNLRDGIHPNAEGQQVIADLLWPRLEALLQTLETAETR